MRIKKGFTIFEIMIVVTIIGLLSMIALPNYIRARNKAIQNICISNQKIIFTSATMYMMNETDSLARMEHKPRLIALTEKGYMKGDKWRRCPSNSNKSYNDYTIIFEGDIVADVECDVKPAEHEWP